MDDNKETEGVIKYKLDFEQAPLPHPALALQLEAWRQRLCALGLIGGNDPARYDGLGFGNLSHRLETGSTNFIISGTQTGHLDKMEPEDYALVTLCDPASNTIRAQGKTAPSSEAMTHAAIYSAAPTAQAVIHVHSPEIWQQAESLGLATTNSNIAYGTTEMAEEFARLISSGFLDSNVISMGGHEDGIVSWGETLDEAGELMLQLASQAGLAERAK
ncbi:hypothetical protein BOV90_11905 [Solemya velum gill symbiont]|uniref:Ribulose-5-phosphate 4-epimerase-like protein n=1 Tax=Solemya velum gill symbiont TaxID=2340 RepID=A0A0B0HF19_SOVGS|nr:class II aldolase/adducin family protein [Solemya velum gill symbiont]KHF26509.1 Ribulose-5-phosphate 4-epimerase-like protein [Solemya velum gill symbiont]OOY35432.1 hypothetical protein BOV88_04055 [Solemya velum gill symbiont]OOY38615.1 hypothetical protein BOV89_02120 [Solemya velum gill symbiont]OOY38957.1 hypothetical protein BOV90_11905 [Solemya velum gill symbiont]OOY43611.1 hypothetical protein BOV91_03570 [Solemya velum gill symbiont]